jgi:hypothetical protein
MDRGSHFMHPEFSVTRDGFHVRLADHKLDALKTKISTLVHRMYSWRGLDTHTPEMQSQRPGQTTLVACKGDLLFGTATVGVDSGHGLLADTLYRPQIDEARRKGARVCEVTRLAMDPSHSSPEVLATIFHLTFIITRVINNMTDLFMEVHPRHTGFYRRMMGCRIAGPELTCPRVGAPAVLMRLSLEHAEEQIQRLGGNKPSEDQDRSLYRLFFSPGEQDHLLSKLRGGTQFGV